MKANVLFFERKEASEKPWTKDLWIYDLRTNQHFTLKTNPLANKDLDDLRKPCYARQPGSRSQKRKETERFKKFTYAEIVARDKANLDILWLKDDSLEDSENLPPPAVSPPRSSKASKPPWKNSARWRRRWPPSAE